MLRKNKDPGVTRKFDVVTIGTREAASAVSGEQPAQAGWCKNSQSGNKNKAERGTI
jgi:hypothetical protein